MFQEGQISIEATGEGGTLLTLPVEVNRKTLRPGFYRINLTVRIKSGTLNHGLPPWIQQGGGMPIPPLKAGEPWEWEKIGGSWSFSPNPVQTRAWQELATLARDVGDRADKLGDLEHAWFSKGQPDGKRFIGPDYNMPPVFQAFYLNELAEQFQRAADTEVHTLVDYTFDVHVVFAGR
jgi:hypothetical protein